MPADPTPLTSYRDRLGQWCLQTAAYLGVALAASLFTRYTGQPAPTLPPPPVVIIGAPGGPPPTVTVVSCPIPNIE